MQLKIEDIIHATGGRCLNPEVIGDTLISAITTDSRKIPQDSLFVPLKGERFDGHAFIQKVKKEGAYATLTENAFVADDTLVHIFVADTGKALLDLACYYRKQFEINVVGVTGSVGKTTTKDMIAAVLGHQLNVLKTQGNYNNEIGLPLTVFGLEKNHQVAVLEMGMNHFDEIRRLTHVAQPQIAVITNIGTSHIENLGSREGILKAKLEILEGLHSDGLFLVNGCDSYLKECAKMWPHTLSYGIGEGFDYEADGIYTKEGLTFAKVKTPKSSFVISIPALGEHMVMNALVAIAIAEHMGLSENEMIEGLMAYTPSKMRMNIVSHSNGITIMDDTYNASPDSMRASLKVLSDYQTQGRRVAILGDMFEMGEYGPKLHEEVGTFILDTAIDTVYCVGELAKYIFKGISQKEKVGLSVHHYQDKESFTKQLEHELKQGDTVLVKASRGMKFEEIVASIGKVK